ncbi:MAG: heavy-metal-associated domain-containing protein [Steroidobacteraceae bacterium]
MFRAGVASFLLLSGSALAAEPRTVTIGVEHMTCAACPITVRKALSQVAGVSASTVDMKAHTATVTFDPGRTTPDALAAAVSNAGFPAKVLRNGG